MPVADAFHAVLATQNRSNERYHTVFDEVPCICLRIPTGGGKTLLAAHGVAMSFRPFADTALVKLLYQRGHYLKKVLHLGRALRRQLPRLKAGKRMKMPRFRYRSRGDTAVIGRSAAVFVLGPLHLTKGIGWLLWGFVHVYLLIGFDRRLSVASQWVWRYLTSERGARLID